MRTLACVAAFLIAAAFVQIVVVWLSSRLLRVRNVTIWRATWTLGVQVLLYAVICLVIGAILFAAARYPRTGDHVAIYLLYRAFYVVYFAASVGLWVATARYALGSNWWQALGIWVGQSVAIFVCMLAFRFLVYEAFVVPTNAMAPSILGHRCLATCPDCGGNVILTADRGKFGNRMAASEGICDQCWKSQAVEADASAVYSGDRIVVTKIEQPRRWDAVTYHPSRAPDQLYVHRLVGLPGERISVRQGALWINGERVSMPAELPKLRYRADAIDENLAENSWQLGPDEYFVLGDNTCFSLDSRHDGPIPKDAVHGVAVAIYWPLTRMRMLRTTTSDSVSGR
jgi:signal peptidase I